MIVKIEVSFIDYTIKPAIENLKNQIEKIDVWLDKEGCHTGTIYERQMSVDLGQKVHLYEEYISAFYRFGDCYMDLDEIRTLEYHKDWEFIGR